MEEDIKNYSPTVMFRGTPCNKMSSLLENECQFYNWMLCFVNYRRLKNFRRSVSILLKKRSRFEIYRIQFSLVLFSLS